MKSGIIFLVKGMFIYSSPVLIIRDLCFNLPTVSVTKMLFGNVFKPCFGIRWHFPFGTKDSDEQVHVSIWTFVCH